MPLRRPAGHPWAARNDVSPAYPSGRSTDPPSVTYFLDDESYKDVQAGGLDEIWYGRFRNPTVDVAAARGRRLEDAEAGVHDVVGHGRDRHALLTLLSAGDRRRGDPGLRRHPRPAGPGPAGLGLRRRPGGRRRPRRLARGGRRPAPRGHVRRDDANPQLELADLPALARTRARPRRPAGRRQHVRDAVLRSAARARRRPRRALGDEVPQRAHRRIAGVVVGPYDLVREVQRRVITLGTCLARTPRTWCGAAADFDLRISQSNATARGARGGADRDRTWSGPPSVPARLLPQADVATRLLRRDPDGSLRAGRWWPSPSPVAIERALRGDAGLRVACEATSLGGVETLVSTPFNSSHFSLSRGATGRPDRRRHVRVCPAASNPPTDLIADLCQRSSDHPMRARTRGSSPDGSSTTTATASYAGDLDRAGFEGLLNEASGLPVVTLVRLDAGARDAPLVWPLLGLDALVEPDEYVRAKRARRRANPRSLLGDGNRRLARRHRACAGAADHAAELASWPVVRATRSSGSSGRPRPAAELGAPRASPTVSRRLRTSGAVGAKSIAAYRVGLELPAAKPTDDALATALGEVAAGSRRLVRLAHPVVQRLSGLDRDRAGHAAAVPRRVRRQRRQPRSTATRCG